MKLKNKNIPFLNLVSFFCCFICFQNSYSQPPLPQRTITVQATQALHFGTFALNGGGDGIVTVSFNGMRTSNTNIFLSPLSPSSQPAIFDIKLCQGRNVTITYIPTIVLSGSNGGSFVMDIGPTEKGGNSSKFAVDNNCNFITTIRVGGTLHIPSVSPPGIYSGNFEIIFEQE